MTTESEDRQHRCPRCNEWFVVNTLLRAHLREAHPSTPIVKEQD